jgi:hypothetical protein
MVAVPKLQVRAIMPGEAISASDGSATIILDDVPFAVKMGDMIGVMGIYRAHSATLINPYDPIFFVRYTDEVE